MGGNLSPVNTDLKNIKNSKKCNSSLCCYFTFFLHYGNKTIGKFNYVVHKFMYENIIDDD